MSMLRNLRFSVQAPCILHAKLLWDLRQATYQTEGTEPQDVKIPCDVCLFCKGIHPISISMLTNCKLATGAGPSHVSDGTSPFRRSNEVAVTIPPLSKVRSSVSKHSDSSAVETADADKPDTSCVICFEELGDHVMMPCGHGGYCRHCAHKLYVRPPNLCPICRSRLSSVVQVSLDAPVGTYTEVL